MATVKQPTKSPTNKLTAATVTGLVMAVSSVIVRNLWPEWYDADLWLAATPFVSLAVGYVVKDAPNVEAG